MVAFRNFANAPNNSKLHKQGEVTRVASLRSHTARHTEGHGLGVLQLEDGAASAEYAGQPFPRRNKGKGKRENPVQTMKACR
jgi:hypothetical protein